MTLVIQVTVFLLAVYAVDSQVPPVLAGLPVTVTEKENQKQEKLVYPVTCTDADGDTIAVTIPTGGVTPSNSPNTELFFVQQIPPTTDFGVYVRGMSDTSLGRFNFTAAPTHSITVSCSDGTNTVTGLLKVTITENPAPVIIDLPLTSPLDVPAATKEGTVVIRANHTDAEGDTVYFDLTCDINPHPFTVRDSGDVQLTQDMDQFENLNYVCTVYIRDATSSGISKVLDITVSGVNFSPIFTNLANTTSVDENTAIGTAVFQVSFTDANAADNHSMWMTSSTSNGDSLFEINPSTGIVTIKDDLNFEGLTDKTYVFNVKLTDDTVIVMSTLNISVNEVNEIPVWNAGTYRTNISESATVGTTIQDPGFAFTNPETWESLTCSMTCLSYTGYFQMLTNCTMKVEAVYSLDAGLPDTVTCTVTVTDTGNNTDTATLIITINDVDNFYPAFTTSTNGYVISAYADIGTSIGTVTATDNDVGKYGMITYTLSQGSTNFFKINGSNGVISTQRVLYNCGCTGTTLQMTAVATDQGDLVGTSLVYVTVLQTTTVVTTTTTDRFKTFFEDKINAAWFSLLMALLAVTLCVTVFVAYKYCLADMIHSCKCKRRRPIRQEEWTPPRQRRVQTPPRRPIAQTRRLPQPIAQPKPHTGFRFWKEDNAF